MSKPWWEQEWTTRQTHQGTWVRVDNGHEYGPDSRTMAMVYAPETRDMEGETLKERSNNADAQALDCAKGMAAAPDMARALLRDVEGHHEGCVCFRCAALRKAGAL